MNLAIRPMQPADLNAVLALASACPEAPFWPPSAYLPYCSPQPDPPLRTGIVAANPNPQGQAILGFAVANLLLDGEQNLCQLDSMAVRPDARRQGLGSALLDAILAWAAENGARRFALEVRASNTAALRLYEHLGLRPEGCRPRYYTHPEEDALLLGRTITPGSPPVGFPR